MFQQREEDLIRQWQDTLQDDVHVEAFVTGDEAGERISTFTERLGALAPGVRVSIASAPGAENPAILVGRHLRFLAAPHGTELAPFLEAVQRFGTAGGADDAGIGSEAVTAGQEVRVYVSPHCPHCPSAVRELLTLLGDDLPVTLTVIDAEVLAEMALRDRVRSVPTVLVGRHYRSTGGVLIDEVRRAVACAEPEAAVLARLLDGGDAAAVAAMMAEAGRVFPAVLDRIAHETMTVRLGAMAALERLIETSPEVAATAEPGLWDRIAGAGREATGDLLYMLGEAGTPATVPWLEAFREATTDQELQEAVADALARLGERAQG